MPIDLSKRKTDCATPADGAVGTALHDGRPGEFVEVALSPGPRLTGADEDRGWWSRACHEELCRQRLEEVHRQLAHEGETLSEAVDRTLRERDEAMAELQAVLIDVVLERIARAMEDEAQDPPPAPIADPPPHTTLDPALTAISTAYLPPTVLEPDPGASGVAALPDLRPPPIAPGFDDPTGDDVAADAPGAAGTVMRGGR